MEAQETENLSTTVIKKKMQCGVIPSSQFPQKYLDYFLSSRLSYDRFGQQLRPDPTHSSGEPNTQIDLCRYVKCEDIVKDLHVKSHPVQSVNLSGQAEGSDHLLDVILKHYQASLEEFNLSKCTSLTTNGLQIVFSFSNLQRLDISYMDIVTDQFLSDLPHHLLHLTHINLSACPNVSDLGVLAVANSLVGVGLQSFECHHMPMITHNSVNQIVFRAENLAYCDVSNCPNLQFFGIVIETHNRIQQYLGRKIRTLNISHCNRMNKVACKYITTGLPLLEAFSAIAVYAIDDEFVYDLLMGCRNLHSLRLNNCIQLTGKVLDTLHSHIDRLVSVELGNIYTINTSNILEKNVIKVSNKADVYSLLTTGTALKTLDLSFHIYLTDSYFITPSANLSPINSSLLELYLRGCTQLTPLAMIYVVNFFPSLEVLDLSDHPHVTNTILQAIASKLQSMRKLYINNCRSLTDEGLASVLVYCKQLTHLYASYDSITNQSDDENAHFGSVKGDQYSDLIWQYIINFARKLEALVLSNQNRITLSSQYLHSLYKSMQQNNRGVIFYLSTLDLRGCENIASDKLMLFMKLFCRLYECIIPVSIVQNNKTLCSNKFYSSTLSKLPYVADYDKSYVLSQLEKARLEGDVMVSAKKTLYGTNQDPTAFNAKQNVNTQIFYLISKHKNYDRLKFHDDCVRRRLLEKWAVSAIALQFRRHLIWKKFKHKLMGRRIWYYYKYRYKAEVEFQRKLTAFIEKRNVKIVERAYYFYKVIYLRSAIKVQRRYRKYIANIHNKILAVKSKKITCIQKRVRGMLTRISERYIIAQIYLKLPNFWKRIANIKAPFVNHDKLPTDNVKVKSSPSKSPTRKSVADGIYDAPRYDVKNKFAHQTEAWEIKDTRKQATKLLHHITQTKHDKKEKLAAKLDMIIPQSFDLSPYVSLSDGRKLSFYSNPISLFQSSFLKTTENMNNFVLSDQQRRFLSGKYSNNTEKFDKKQIYTAEDLHLPLPMHIYNFKYWPVTRTHQQYNTASGMSSSVQPDDDIYNPHINNFEYVLNKKYVLYCEQCSHRLRLIHCQVCNKGYCFHCAYFAHNSILTRNHVMSYTEPRVYKMHNVSKSLLYFINNSYITLHSIQYLYKYLSSISEVRRIQQERALVKEYEKEQERLRLIFLKSQEKYKLEFNQANTIILFYKGYMARKLVSQKRIQKQIEIHMKNVSSCSLGIVKLQVLARRFLTRIWLYKKGFVFNSVPKYYFTIKTGNTAGKGSKLLGRSLFGSTKGNAQTSQKVFHKPKKSKNSKFKHVPPEELASRCKLDVTRRVYYGRNKILGDLDQFYAAGEQFIITNVEYWKKQHEKLLPLLEKYRKLREEYHNDYKALQLQNHVQEHSASEPSSIVSQAVGGKQPSGRFNHNNSAYRLKKGNSKLNRINSSTLDSNSLESNTILSGSVSEENHTEAPQPAPVSILASLNSFRPTAQPMPQTNPDLFHTIKNKGKKYNVSSKQLEKILFMKYEHMDLRVEIYSNILWWIVQLVRLFYRRLGIFKVRYTDTVKRLNYIFSEFQVLDRIYSHAKERVNDVEYDADGLEWVKQQRVLISRQLVMLDAAQESLLKEELARTESNNKEMGVFSTLLSELVQSLLINNQLYAEKIQLEIQLYLLPTNTDESLQCNQQLILLKNKQKVLQNQSIDSLKVTLQGLLDGYDQQYVSSYAFPNDKPEMTILELHTIEVVLLDEFVEKQQTHLKLDQWLIVLLLQPWLVQQCIDDIRFEERVNAKLLRYTTLQEEYNNLQVHIAEYEQTITTLMTEAQGIETEVLANLDPPEREPEADLVAREAKLGQLKQSLEAKQLTIDMTKRVLNEEELKLQPLKAYMDEVLKEVMEVKKQLEARLEAREKVITQFFAHEQKILANVILEVEKTVYATEDQIMTLQQKVDRIQRSQLTYNQLKEEGEGMNSAHYDYLPPTLCLPHSTLELQALYHTQKAFLYADSFTFISTQLQYQVRSFESQITALQNKLKLLQEELTFLKNYPKKVPVYRQYVSIFINELQISRRQKALDLDLDVRRGRLDSFREARLRSLQQLKQQQLAEEMALKLAMEEKLRRRQGTLKRLVKRTVKFAKNVNRAIEKALAASEAAAVEMDDEEKHMAKIMRTRNKEGIGGGLECLKSIYLTANSKEYTYFTKQNDHLQEKGLPFYLPMERSLGGSVYLWQQRTFDQSIFITDIQLSHKDPTNEYYKVPSKKQEVIANDFIPFFLYTRKDEQNSKAIKGLYVSFKEEEENEFIINGYQKLEPNLDVFGLPSMCLWVEKAYKSMQSSLTNTNALISEINKVRHLLSEQPTNRNLKSLLERLNAKLAAAHEKEVANQITNPLAYSMEMFSLSEQDVMMFMKFFEKIDKKKLGVVSLKHVFDFIDQPMTPITEEVFRGVDALDQNQMIEFGDFVRAIGTYCFFGKEEILRFIYIFADQDRTGSITFGEFTQLVETLNPYEKLRARRAMKAMGLTKDNTVSFESFRLLNEQLPSLFLPAFLLQNAFREKILGVDWWFEKLSKYKQVRDKIASEGRFAEIAVNRELERFENEQARQQRIAERAKLLETETSEIRKTILKARQFLDEVQEES